MVDDWQSGHGQIQGNDACLVENLRVRGMKWSCGFRLFMLPPDVQRHELSHEQDTAAIVEFGRQHGITVEPGEIIEAAAVVRTFRNWRMTGAGCSWPSSEGDILKEPDGQVATDEDGQRFCNVCGQAVTRD